jgi:flagellar motor switch protein FliN/FliY
MKIDQALLRLGESTAEAVEGVLATFAPPVDRGTPVVMADGVPPLDAIVVPAVATAVSYVDGVLGGNIFVISVLGARRLAALLMGVDSSNDVDGADLTELELAAVGEAMSQMMAAAAGATGTVLGSAVEIGAPETTFFSTQAAASAAFESAAHAVATSFVVCGEPARLVQLVPQALVVRMIRAVGDPATAAITPTTDASSTETVPDRVLREVPVCVSAELGRFRMGVARAVRLQPGSVVVLDAGADDPVALFVNGRSFGTGRLLVTNDGEWAVRLEQLCVPTGIPGARDQPEGD